MLRTLYLIFACCAVLLVAPKVMAADANPKTILVWGDSLSAAYGIPLEKGWVSLLQTQLGSSYQISNGSISGETTAGGLSRFPKALSDTKPDYVLFELGANDGLRGIDPAVTRQNLTQMIQLAQASHAKVVLIGIKVPPNYGAAFTEKFEAVFSDLAKQYSLPFVPFLLEGVADNWDLVQADGLHPTAEAQPKLLANVWPVLEAVLTPPAKTH